VAFAGDAPATEVEEELVGLAVMAPDANGWAWSTEKTAAVLYVMTAGLGVVGVRGIDGGRRRWLGRGGDRERGSERGRVRAARVRGGGGAARGAP
jgi:hypothetical protein